MKDMDKTIGTGGVRARQTAGSDPLGPNTEIGRKLKEYYNDLVSDDVPDRFAQLLSQLEQSESARKKD